MTDRETKPNRAGRARLLVPFVAALALAACSGPNPQSDFRQTHPIVVSPETVTLKVTAPADGMVLTGADRKRFEHFVADFLNRGRSAMTVGTGGGAEALRRMLIDAGVRPGEISVSGAGGGDGAATASFTAMKAEVPKCGDYTSTLAINPSNRPESNWGCASQRNIGLMVRDPGDLVKGQPESGASAQRTKVIIDVYRAPAVQGGQ